MVNKIKHTPPTSFPPKNDQQRNSKQKREKEHCFGQDNEGVKKRGRVNGSGDGQGGRAELNDYPSAGGTEVREQKKMRCF